MTPSKALTLPALLRNCIVLFLGVLIATGLMDSIHADSTATLVIVALVLALLNLVLKPILILFALPFVLLSMGLGLFVINALLLLLASRLVEGFHVDGFFPAFLASLLISSISLLLNLLIGPKPNVRFNVKVSSSNSRRSQRQRPSIDKDDAIDV